MFISFLYMFRATVCPSSGEITVSMRHLGLVTLYGLLSDIQDGMKNFAPSSLYLQGYTAMHGQKNIKNASSYLTPRNSFRVK